MNVAIIQARTGSTRLPGKVLLPLLGRPILLHVIQRLKRAAQVGSLVVATSSVPADDAIAALAEQAGIGCFRGSEQDVLDRYVGAARWAGAQHIIRITADCPFVDPDIVDQVIGAHLHVGADYTSNTLQRTFPHGADVEIFTREALEEAGACATQPAEREHVTPFLWSRPERFKVHQVVAGSPLQHPEYRLTVDTEEDYMLTRAVYETLGSGDFPMADIIALFERHPWLPYINRHVAQKIVITEANPQSALATECVHAGRWAERQDLHQAATLLFTKARELGFTDVSS